MIDLKPACARMADLLTRVTTGQLLDSTSCAEYSVRDLIDHVDSVSRGFTALARKDLGEQTDADGQRLAANLGDYWRDSVAKHVRALGEAWDDPGAWEGSTSAGGLDLPNELWGKIALTEMVVHGWDLAKATGQPFDLPEATLRACFDHLAGFLPNAPVEGLWGPPVAVSADAALLDRTVAITGRTPEHPAGPDSRKEC
jgi:uncharacterized protein (TIGR03086 family)